MASTSHEERTSKWFRDWKEFVSDFSAPESADKVVGRLQVNFELYLTNYAAVAGLVVLLASAFVEKLGISLFWPFVATALSFLLKDGHPISGELQMNSTLRLFIGLSTSILSIVIYETFGKLLWALAIGLLVCGTHAVLKIRPPLQANIQKFENQVDAVSKSVGQSVDSMVQSATSLVQQLKRKAE